MQAQTELVQAELTYRQAGRQADIHIHTYIHTYCTGRQAVTKGISKNAAVKKKQYQTNQVEIQSKTFLDGTNKPGQFSHRDYCVCRVCRPKRLEIHAK